MSIKGMGYQITSSDGEITRRSIIGADDKKSSAKYVSKASGMNEVTANSYGGNSSRSNSGTQVSGIQGFFQKPLMEGVLPDSKGVIRQMCRDAFRYDPVAGPMVELLSILPWSGITLTGIKDSSVLEKYTTSITNMNLMNLMPELTVDYLVNGAFVAQNIFDSSNGVFTGISPQSIDACDITPVPIYGVDPLINLRFSDEFKRLLDASKTDSRAKAIVDDLGASFQNDLKRGVMQLDPEVTTYIPRRTFASELYGTSYLQRIIPYWIIEKALLRGTIELSYRRQKSILHLILGDEDWEATEEDMRATVQKWLDADQDPTGAIIATRPGVVPTEVRCVAGNTLISTDKGVRRIDSLFDHDVNGKPFSMNTNVRVKGIDGKLHGVAEWHFHGIKPTLNIKTSSGSEITATKNHKFLVVKDGGKLEFVTADKLDGQLVCLEEKGEHKSAKQLALNVKKPSVIERSDNQDIILPKVMTPDLAYVIGLVVSEGYMSKKSIQVVNTNMEVHKKYCEAFAKVFGRVPSTRLVRNMGENTFYDGATYQTKACHSSDINSIKVVKFLKSIGVKQSIRKKKSPSYYKHVPWSIMQSDDESRHAFFAGYIEGDGTVTIKSNATDKAVELAIFSRSSKTLLGMKTLLSDMGYHSRFERESYRLYIPTSDASRLYNRVSSYFTKRRAKVTECGAPRSRQFGIPAEMFVPFLEARYIGRKHWTRSDPTGGHYFVNDAGEKVLTDTTWGDGFRHYKSVGSYFLYDTFDEGGYATELAFIKKVSKTLHANIMRLMGLRYRFDRVVSVKEGKARPVYDLTMKEGQAPVYVANGIVTHNSGSDFWRIDEIQSFTTDVKFRALGGNESLLSGDINLNTMDNAMSTFLERLRYMRNVITYRLFSQRIFPHIAVKNGFRAKSNTMRHEITGKDSVHLGTDSNLFTLFSGAGVFENGLAKGVYSETFNPSEYSIPKVNWIKHLKPEADSAYMEILEKLEEKGLPIPLRIWSAAAGVNVAEVMYGYEDDLKIRRRAAAHAKQIPKTKSNDEEGGGSFAEAIAEAMAVKEPKSRKAIIRALSSKFGRKHPHLAAASANKLRPMGLDRFNSQEINESMRDPDTGRTLSRKGRRVMVERVHKVAAEAASRIAQRENYKMKSK